MGPWLLPLLLTAGGSIGLSKLIDAIWGTEGEKVTKLTLEHQMKLARMQQEQTGRERTAMTSLREEDLRKQARAAKMALELSKADIQQQTGMAQVGLMGQEGQARAMQAKAVGSNPMALMAMADSEAPAIADMLGS